MSEAPERIWIEDEFGDGDDDQWTYGTWDVRNYMGYDVEYVRADIVQTLTAEREAFEQDNHRWKMECENFWRDRERILTAERDRLRKALEDIIADCEADYPPSHGAIKYAAKLALKGETP